ncbi:uncharacterized protein LOC121180247 isoform X1 [Tachysurus ichikawai]
MNENCPSLSSFSTDELIQKIIEAGIQINKEEARKFRENDIEGETVDCGLTEAMVGYLFDGSFKKQLKFQQFVCHYKENETIVVLEPVPVKVAQSTAELQPHPSTDPSVEAAHRGLPTNILCIQLMQSIFKLPLIVKYPFLRDKEGNGYHTWHMSLKREFKAERAPLVSDSEVRKLKEKFGHTKQSRSTSASGSLCRKPARVAYFFDEIDRIHPTESREGFARVLPNVLKLATAKSPLAKQYIETRQDALAEDLPGIDLRAGLIILPFIFREKIEHYITMKEIDPATPFPTIQLMENDWKMAQRGEGGWHGCVPRSIVNIVEEGDKPLPVTLLRMINLLY